MRYRSVIFAALAWLPVGLAGAQTLPQIPGGGSAPKIPGGASLMGGGIPNLSSVGVPNAAGVLGYCVQHKYLSGGAANNVLGGLLKTPGIKSKPEYNAGSAGKIITGKGAPFSLNSVPSQVQDQACDLMLKQGSKLL